MSDNRTLGTIHNNNVNNILAWSSGVGMTPAEYREAVDHLLDGKPGLLAQNVGIPDPVIYRSDVATRWDAHLVEVSRMTWPKQAPDDAQRQAGAMAKLVSAGTDPLQLTIEACRARGTPVVAGYRMNEEQWYPNSWRLCDFGRAHPEWRIPTSDAVKAEVKRQGGAAPDFHGNMDPAVPEVFDHRMRIFTEVAEKYDIDGIEFDFRRWYHMISDPLKNHAVLTRMVRETRRMLNAVVRKKGRERLLLGARVAPMISGAYRKSDFPGAIATEASGANASCRDLGLDVESWVKEELVDYLCPSLWHPYLPGLPRTAEYVALAKDKPIGIYPTIFPWPAWGDDAISIPGAPAEELLAMMRRHRNDICNAALKCYEEGADGVSTHIWNGHCLFSRLARENGLAQRKYRGSLPYMKTELFVHRFLGSAEALRECLQKEPKAAPEPLWAT